MTLTSEEYAARAGGCCPFCLSGYITGGATGFSSNIAWMNVRCNECGKKWSDEYILTGYSEVV